MPKVEIPGWWSDAMEQALGLLIAQQRETNHSLEELTGILLDPEVRNSNEKLSTEEHMNTLALCVAICVRRLARIDMPT